MIINHSYCGISAGGEELITLNELVRKYCARKLVDLTSNVANAASALVGGKPESESCHAVGGDGERDLEGLLSGTKANLEKIVEFKGKNRFSWRICDGPIKRRDLETRLYYTRIAKRKLTEYYCKMIQFYSRQYNINYAKLIQVVFLGVSPVLRESDFVPRGEGIPTFRDHNDLPQLEDPSYKARPVREALRMFPEHQEFYLHYRVDFNRNGFMSMEKASNDGGGCFLTHMDRAKYAV